MRLTAFLVFTRRGVKRVTKHLPDLRGGEYAVRLKIEAPDSLFTADTPVVEVTLPPRSIIVPTVTVEPVDAATPNDGQRQ
jgi:hypothetical protein